MRCESPSVRGTALLPALVVTALLVGLGGAALVTSSYLVRDTEARIARAQARYLAMLAAARSHDEVNRGLDGRIDPGDSGGGLLDPLSPITDPLLQPLLGGPAQVSGSYSARANRLSDGSYLIEATGVAKGSAQGLGMVVRPPGGSALDRFAAFGGSGITAHGRIFADAYDSSLAAYALQALPLGFGLERRALGTAKVGSNGSIALAGGSVYGDVTPGPGGIYTSGGTRVTGSTAPAAAELELPSARYAPPPSNDNSSLPGLSGGALSLSSGSHAVGSGVYVVSSATIGGSANLRVTGDVTLFVGGDWTISGSAKITVEPGASLVVYATGGVAIGGGGIVNQTGGLVGGLLAPLTREGSPKKLRIFHAPDVDEGEEAPPFSITTGAPLFGVVYAPKSAVAIGNGVEIFGALAGGSITLADSSRFHHDDALSRQGGLLALLGLGPRYELYARWWAPR